MITHVVAFRWQPGTPDEHITRLAAALDELATTVPSVRSFAHGSNLGLGTSNADYALVATFDDLDGYHAYDSHPAHDAVRSALIRPVLAERAAVQFEH